MIKEPMDKNEFNYPMALYKRISWSAIVIGSLVGVGLGFLLNLFGVAIGLSALATAEDVTNIAVGGFIGLLIGVIASMTAAGYTAGYFGRLCCPRRNLGIVYGFTTWTLGLLLAVVLAGPMSVYLSNSRLTNALVITTSQPIAPEPSEEALSAEKAQLRAQDTSPSTAAWASSMVFVLFFIGALSSCLGACWGMSCKRDD